MRHKNDSLRAFEREVSVPIVRDTQGTDCSPLLRACSIVGRAATIRYGHHATLGDAAPQGYVRFEMTHRWVRNLAILHGHIEVDTDEDLLVLEVEVGDCELLRERHGWR